MADNDLWEQFVQENWAPALERAYGPDWRRTHPEEVSAIFKCATRQSKDRENETMATKPFASEQPSVQSKPPAAQDSALTFGSFQATPVDGDKSSVSEAKTQAEQLKKESVSLHRTRSPVIARRSTQQPRSAIKVEGMVDEDLQRDSWSGNVASVGLNPLDLDAFTGIDWDDFDMPSDEIARACSLMQEKMASKGHAPGSRQERRKAKRSGGTKRQTDDPCSSANHPPAADKQHVTQVEHRIEITGGSATYTTHSRSVPSKQVSGITNQPTFRIPVDHSLTVGTSPAMFRGYSFTGSTAENGGTFKGSFTSSTSQSGNIQYSSNPSSIFSLFGERSASMDGMDDWMMDDPTGMGMDMDDPHHPHKKVHKHFTAEATGKVSKTTKKHGRRHGHRQSNTVFSTRVPCHIHSMTSPPAPFPSKHCSDEGSDGTRDSGSQSKPADGLGDSKGKKDESGRRRGHGKNSNQSGTELRCTIEVTHSQRPPTSDPPRKPMSGGRPLGSTCQHMQPPKECDPYGSHQTTAKLVPESSRETRVSSTVDSVVQDSVLGYH